FGGNYDTGLELYKSQPMVTISGNGGSAPAPGGDYATSAAAPPAASSAGVPGANRGVLVPSSGAVCVDGLMQCSGAGYKVCVGGQWSNEYTCGPGTVCKGTSGHIYCDFA
ncbi:hypothetical protein H4R19_006800, partial [Coemansia spiralis]